MTIELLLNELRWEGVTLSLNGENLRYRSEVSPLPPEIKQKLSTQKSNIIKHLRYIRRNTEAGLPRLSNLQQAYWLGEQSAFRYSIPATVHLVYATPVLEPGRLEEAVLKVMRRHPPLRMRIDADGKPSLMMAQTAPVEYMDVYNADSSQHMVIGDATSWLPKLEDGPPFKLLVVRGKTGTYMHALLRLIIFDAPAVGIFMDDLATAYGDPNSCASWEGPAPCYAQLAEAIDTVETKTRYKSVKNYWNQRLRTLPPAPKLPVKAMPPKRIKFERYHGTMEKAKWLRLQETARERGLSINAVLASIFAYALQRWSENKSFTINTMFSKRYEIGSVVEGAIGNYSSTLLLSIDADRGSFGEQARRFQKTLYEAMDRSVFDGVSALRALGSEASGVADPSQPVMPVVFSTLIGTSASQDRPHVRLGWKMTDSSMTTPQVWLDHQVYEIEGDLAFNWDVVEGIYPEKMIEGAFAHYRNILNTLAEDTGTWANNKSFDLPDTLLVARRAANATQRRIEPSTLHAGLWENACKYPDAPAIVHQNSQLTFRQAANLANRLAKQLVDSGLQPGDHIIVHGHKTPEIIIALFGVLAANCIYVPASPRTPVNRIVHIAQHSGAKAILSDDKEVRTAFRGRDVSIIDHAKVLLNGEDGDGASVPLRDPDPEAPAYVIYTSGSTGLPKGVVIKHRAAANTISDVLERFSITPDDRLLAISELTFDLSVFDVFAIALGRTCLVLPEDKGLADPGAWLAAAREHGATVWNSVPAIMDMMANYLSGSGGDQVLDYRRDEMAGDLRLFMASGDWIPLNLPDRLWQLFPGSKFISLGGATEASIWSNYFDVEHVVPEWRSIPYGFPLANQRFYILDEDLQPSPPHVPGYLYIAGDGLAEGYLNDPEQTAESFFYSPSVGERVYRTGDLGSYNADGCIEFLGRRDFQVKIHGHRIELGEIEKTLQDYPGVDRAVALVHKDDTGDASIAAAVVWKGKRDCEGALNNAAENLPSYMVPRRIESLNALPLTENGKLDRKQLEKIIEQVGPLRTDEDVTLPKSKAEKRVAAAWEKVLGTAPGSVTVSFFETGGDSLKAVHLLNELNQSFERPFALDELYRHNTVRKQASLLSTTTVRNSTSLVPMNLSDSASTVLYMFHPVGGAVICYSSLAKALEGKASVVGVAANESMAQKTIPKMADYYARDIVGHGKKKQVILGGWSMGGIIALETARILEQLDFPIEHVVTIDSWAPVSDGHHERIPEALFALNFIADLAGIARDEDRNVLLKGDTSTMDIKEIFSWALHCGILPEGLTEDLLSRRFKLFHQNYRALLRHRIFPPAAPTIAVTALRQDRKMIGLAPLTHVVPDFAKNEVTVQADHYSILNEPFLGRLSVIFQDLIKTTPAVSRVHNAR